MSDAARTDSVWNDRPVEGVFEGPAQARWYRIRNVDRLPPFFTTLASSSDHWLFASSRGPLTCGRRSKHAALFPYTTEDRIHDAVDVTGSRTIVHVDGVQGPPWEPGSSRGPGLRDLSRDLCKHTLGHALAFEEHEHGLGLTLRIEWTTSPKHGVVRRATLTNHGASARRLRIVDGLLNLLPADVDPQMQAGFSNLLDAYKTARLVGPARLGVFALSSIPVDRAEPSEALRATTLRCLGAPGGERLLSTRQLEDALRGAPTHSEERARGARCAYLIDRTLELEPGGSTSWTFVLEVEQDAAAVRRLADDPRDDAALLAEIDADLAASEASLRALLAPADAFCDTGRPARDARHTSNTLFNLMRGGTFPDGATQHRDDFADWLATTAPQVHARHRAALADWPAHGPRAGFGALAAERGDPDLVRLHREYLPLAFSRRHGDPSRPWNTFSIPSRNADGSLQRGYEGNWRDIFQNWEALARSFPDYAPAFVTRFVNASTADGYNPYRITRTGADWEVEDPDDPWSFIGYWGDHQIVYLGRLVERCLELSPGALDDLLDRSDFVSVDVPYRIRGYDSLVEDPRDTVVFDPQRAAEIDQLVALHGNEGKLVRRRDGELLRQTFADKLLVPFLVKLSNFVPGAGVWMNTQRPEWNDANNALVGQGASMVTACALWSHAGLLQELFDSVGDRWSLLDSTAALLSDLLEAMGAHDIEAATTDPRVRRRFTDAVGRAGAAHRDRVHARAFGDSRQASTAVLRAMLLAARCYLEASIHANRRVDGLYHGYNLITFEGDDALTIRRLDLMLEGQAAVLASGLLDGPASVAVLDALRASPLYCPRRDSYVLYPDRELTPLDDKNVLPANLVERYPAAARLAEELLAAGDDRIVRRDDDGRTLRFAPGLRNVRFLHAALGELGNRGPRSAAPEERAELAAAYEEVFDHAAFTGRSGTFFGYEGLGCIYWHMVSKLVLATQETLWRHVDADGDAEITARLRDHYIALRAGLGMEASPAAWGAFPTDAYSHTPRDGGAKQPGMTGQVKEDILSHLGDLGIRIVDGSLRFDPLLVEYERAEFTVCGVPVEVRPGESDEIVVRRGGDGSTQTVAGHRLGRALTAELLGGRRPDGVRGLTIHRGPADR